MTSGQKNLLFFSLIVVAGAAVGVTIHFLNKNKQTKNVDEKRETQINVEKMDNVKIVPSNIKVDAKSVLQKLKKA